MLQLTAKGFTSNVDRVYLGTVKNLSLDPDIQLLIDNTAPSNSPIGAVCFADTIDSEVTIPTVFGINRNFRISDGDIVGIFPNGKVQNLFQASSDHNSLFITERCNSNCLMCSQPPKNQDDLDFLFHINNKLIDLLPENTTSLGITGGEPTILGSRLTSLLKKLEQLHPHIHVHLLTNGRAFAIDRYAKEVSTANHQLHIGIPIYSDLASAHDYIVQSGGAYNQTIRGLYNLARYDANIELRVVLHKSSVERLPKLARFIYKNLPFAKHIAFMGLEYIGYTPYNHDSLWIEPSQYIDNLVDSAEFLDCVGMTVSIYNLQHCLAPKVLWPFMKKSISDWKREYLPECSKCTMLDECGGVFGTSKLLSNEIRAFSI